MSGLPYFEDLRLDKALEFLSPEHEWQIYEKLDGSFLQFGLDDEGRPYTNRKTAQNCYSLDDWPTECWADTYRQAHVVAIWLLHLLAEKGVLKAGQFFTAELIPDDRPNTVLYRIETPRFVVTSQSFEYPDQGSARIAEAILCGNMSFWHEFRFSLDGKNLMTSEDLVTWYIDTNPVLFRRDRAIRNYLNNFREAMIILSQNPIGVGDLTEMDLLTMPMNRKPDGFAGNWNEEKAKLVAMRETVRERYRQELIVVRNHLYEVMSQQPKFMSYRGDCEGFVVVSSVTTFKLVIKEQFQPANKFAHIVKYWLVGGRRPARPCFLSRTKDWPKQQRLDRLEVLRKRYFEKHKKLFAFYEPSKLRPVQQVDYSFGPLHNRMVNLFYDTKKRIEDGR
jgi:hypothetical protein